MEIQGQPPAVSMLQAPGLSQNQLKLLEPCGSGCDAPSPGCPLQPLGIPSSILQLPESARGRVVERVSALQSRHAPTIRELGQVREWVSHQSAVCFYFSWEVALPSRT